MTIPLSLAVSNICLICFILCALIYPNKNKTRFTKEIVLPIVFFLFMCASYFWSIDKELTIVAIPKEISLFLIPIVMLIMKPISEKQKQKILKYFSFSMLGFVLYFLIRALIRFIILKETSVFFYHGDYDLDYGLVPKDLNAIHFSVFISIAYFYFIKKKVKTIIDNGILALFFCFILLLSSKNIILVFLILNLIYFFFYLKSANKMRLRNLITVIFIIGIVFSFGKIKDRFLIEFQTNTPKNINSNVVENLPQGIHNVSIIEAWNNETFSPNDFFPGTAFRVYQARLFLEFLKEEPIFWKGFGLNASFKKLEDKGIHYNVFLGNEEHEGYQKKNFHNQYIQIFAELGFLGFIIFILILFINTKKAFKDKDFMHITFAILMLSLFLTESFLWRQRGIVFFTIFYCLFNAPSVKFNLEERK